MADPKADPWAQDIRWIARHLDRLIAERQRKANETQVQLPADEANEANTPVKTGVSIIDVTEG
mgnify:CR=1 FL=1